ncbi:MAG: SUMF1/EgtB/PvdO family nonheme iron enzyme [Pseudomonadota bacterium]
MRRQADTALDSVAMEPATRERAFTRLFAELVSLDDERRPTRRRAPWPSDTETSALAAALVNARLLVSDGEQEGPDRTLEVAHEALFTQWPRLQRWLHERGYDLSLLRQLERDARRWAEAMARRQGDELSLRWHRGRAPEIRRALSAITGGGVESLGEPMRSFVCPRREDWERVDRPFLERIELRERAMDFAARAPKGMDVDGDGLPDIAWVEIPGGEVTLEGGAGTFSTPAHYALGRYPVTYAQFMAFLADPESSPAGPWYAGLDHPHGDEPPKPTIREPWRPVVGVSWYDAVAFCRWLTARRAAVLGGQEIRLPTEWEWEWAARGREEQREFAWEGPWVDGYANLLEQEAGTTSPVDLCPQGGARDGMGDCTGNVEEWCLNEYEVADNQAVDGAKERSVRGGNWSLARRYARCAYRYWSHPYFRVILVGFRVCRCSPSS